MMAKAHRAAHYLGLDIGEKRIGVAYADGAVPIAIALTTLHVDGSEKTALAKILEEKSITTVVVGRPRAQSGYETAQTETVAHMAGELLGAFTGDVVYQDESLTSVTAETHLASGKKPYQKEDIDAVAAAIILQDYLDQGGA